MELANCLVALGGDIENTVPKFDVTPAEVLVLMAIHGKDAVTDVEPTGNSVTRSNAEELARLKFTYPAKDADNQPVVQRIYSGSRPELHETFAELELPETSYKVLQRVKPAAAAAAPKPKAAKVKPAPAAEVLADGPTGEPDNSADDLFD